MNHQTKLSIVTAVTCIVSSVAFAQVPIPDNIRSQLVDRGVLTGKVLDTFSIRGASMRESNLEGASAKGTDFTGTDLAKSKMDGIALDYAKLDNANMNHVVMRDASLQSASAKSVNLVGADLARTKMNGAALDYANLSVANLSGAILPDAAKMTGALVYGTTRDPNWRPSTTDFRSDAYKAELVQYLEGVKGRLTSDPAKAGVQIAIDELNQHMPSMPSIPVR